MKKLFILTGIVISATAFKTIADELTKYGIKSSEVKQAVIDKATNNYIPLDESGITNLRNNVKKMTPDERGVFAKTLGLFVKNYVSSPAFSAELNKTVDAGKRDTNPNSEDWKATYEAEYSSNFASINSLIEAGMITDEYFASFETMNQGFRSQQGNQMEPETATYLARQIKLNEAIVALKPVFKLNKTEFAKKYAALFASRKVEDDIDTAKQQNKELDKKKDYKSNISNLLQQFLEQTEGVDYEAKTFKNGSVTEYANEEYRRKPPVWKAAFRVGKPAMMVARQIAEEWKKDLSQ